MVTTLFCDLVDFTGLCEGTDPEDVDRFLRDYYTLARHLIELYGGVVEKFVGDAVVGVFGVPTAHEDDAERAVRAAARLVTEVPGLSSPDGTARQVRVGVDTGTAVVRLAAEPGLGESILTGDAVVTASRLQGIARAGSVVVGEMTRSLTSRVAGFEAMKPVQLKGQSTAMRPWMLTGEPARLVAEVPHDFSSPFVGREVELGLLAGMFERAAASFSTQMALIVGEAGIGKSRLVAELARTLDERPGVLVQWRHVRCPAFGDKLGFRPMMQIVRQQAGIGDADGPDETEAKLRRMLHEQPDGEWLASRLRPLVGLPSSPASPHENFAAWRRFLEMICMIRPTVLVIEDIHHASEEGLEFTRYLLDNLGDVPLLAIATSRPELIASRPDYHVSRVPYAEGARTVQLDLHPLSRSETDRLVSALADCDGVEQAQELIVERSGGNPLYAEELVRVIREQSSGGPAAVSVATADPRLDLTATLQSVIAARLDNLSPGLKLLVADAAIIGEVFWAGALSAVSGRALSDVDTALVELADRGLVRSVRGSSVPRDAQFVFRHALTREVAYAQIPRDRRAQRHEAVAGWLEERGLGQSEHFAELLAHHYRTAFELRSTLHDEVGAEALRGKAVLSLALAGDVTQSIDVAAADRYLEAAAALATEQDPAWPQILLARGDTLSQLGRLEEGMSAMRSAADSLRERGERSSYAVALMKLAASLYWHDGQIASELRDKALAELADDHGSPELVHVLEECVVQYSHDYQSMRAVELADRALALCTDLGLPEPLRALAHRGSCRSELDDAGGIDDLRRALALAKDQGRGLDADIAGSLLADALFAWQGPAAALYARQDGLEFASHRGDRLATRWFQEDLILDLFLNGSWDEAQAGITELEPELEEAGAPHDLWELRVFDARLHLERGRTVEAERVASCCAESATQGAGNLLAVQPILAAARLAQGDRDDAIRLLTEVERSSRGRRGAQTLAYVLPLAVRTAIAAGCASLAQALLDGAPSSRPLERSASRLLHALLAETTGDLGAAERSHAEAAAAWDAFGMPHEQALALLGRGRCLLALGRAPEAAVPLAEARAILARLGAAPALEETEALLRRAHATAR